jgi:hypothetical protein
MEGERLAVVRRPRGMRPHSTVLRRPNGTSGDRRVWATAAVALDASSYPAMDSLAQGTNSLTSDARQDFEAMTRAVVGVK